MPADEVAEARELLEWLVDDHFTFLGVREYALKQVDGEDVLVATPGTGLGILRSDQRISSSFDKLPPEVRAKAREPQLLVLTEANSRSTVHRPAYLDYVGVKSFDADGAVTGERRFLGLFTSAAYAESVLRVPVLRRKVREVLNASGFEPASHDGKNLLQLLETYPRDELFQISTQELLPDRGVDPGHAGTASDPALPAPRRLRPVHVLHGLPAAGPLHDPRAPRHGRHPAGGVQRSGGRLHRAGV